MQDNFRKTLLDYPLDKVKKTVLNKVSKVMNDKKRFDMKLIEKSSSAAYGLAKWCKAILKYAEARERSKPLEDKMAKMKKEFAE